MNTSTQPTEILGNKDAPQVIKFEYCGGWGYRRHAVAAIAKIEEAVGAGQFQYNLYMDPGVTGRLEVTLYKGKDDQDSGSSVVLHSKKESKKYIHDGYETFLAMLAEAMKWKHIQAIWLDEATNRLSLELG